ncbi:MAG: tetratricopeptide repeat protein [Planctomycetes bacterium]|nr:tetratricopeptide repeat protein [Planctomycetota bacterium]
MRSPLTLRPKRASAFLLPGACAALLLPTAGPAAQRSKREYSGRRCEVVSDAPPEVAKAAVEWIDRFGEVFEKFYAPFGLEKRTDNAVKARLFSGYDEFVEFRDKDVGEKPWSAYFSRSLNSLVAYHDPRDRRLLHTLFHEVQHQFLARFTGAAPKWLNEGLSEYFEGWRIGKEGSFEPAPHLYDLHVLQASLKRGKSLPLETLVSLSPEAFVEFAKQQPGLPPNLHYATSWGLVYYLVSLAPPEEKPLLGEYLKALNAKGSKAEKARIGIGDWKAFEARWREAILALQAEHSSVDDHLALAAGYREDGDWKNAIGAYEAALRLEPGALGVRYWLGSCQKRAGDYAAAGRTLEEARKEDEGDPRPSYLLARIAAGVDKKGAPADPAGALELAREAFVRSGEQNPRYLAFVARCQRLGGDRNAALATMQRVLKLADDEDRPEYERLRDDLRK